MKVNQFKMPTEEFNNMEKQIQELYKSHPKHILELREIHHIITMNRWLIKWGKQPFDGVVERVRNRIQIILKK